MSVLDLGHVPDPPTLFLPHAYRCHPGARPHPNTHCYREAELENRVEDYILERFPHMSLSRQETWQMDLETES